MKAISKKEKRENTINNARRVLERVFALLMVVQILCGIAWLVKNIGFEALFYETQVYLKAAEDLVIDEYMGILYPLLIWVAKGAEKLLKVPYYMMMYVMQLAAALSAVSHFLQQRGWIRETGRSSMTRKWFLVVYLVTFPMLLQLHLAVLPYSLAWSVFVVLISEGMYYMKHTGEICGKVLMKLCGLWILGYILLPDYGWLMGVFVCGVFCKILLKNRKWALRLLTAFLSTVLCFGVIAGSTQTPGSMGRMQKTVGAVLVHRFVWPYFVRDSFFWDERVTDTFEYYDLLEFAQSPEAVDYKFGPILEEKYGKEEANDIYWDMAVISFSSGSKKTLLNITRDFFVNLCPQAGMQLMLRDNDASLVGWNYGRIQEYSPIIARYYVEFSMAGWNVMCLTAVLMLCSNEAARWKDRLRKHKQQREGTWTVLITLLCLTVWYTMSRGMQDYKYVALNSFFWMLPVIYGYLKAGKDPK